MFEKITPPFLAGMKPYSPGKPIEEVKREYNLTDVIKIASNENPLGPSPRAVKAISETLGGLNRYPDMGGASLKKALAAKRGLAPENFVLGNGSDEIIELAARLFAPGGEVLISEPTFSFYAQAAQAAGARVSRAPLKNLRHDLAALARRVRDDTRLIYLDNPNNPAGTYLAPGEVLSFMRDLPETVVLVLDEAYRDFVRGQELIDAGQVIASGRPVLFLYTFSKAYGLAGLRVGYGLGHAELIGMLDRVRQPFNMNLLALAGAEAALDDEEFYRQTIALTHQELDWFQDRLGRMGLGCHDTNTNYFLIDLGQNAAQVFTGLLAKGVIVRPMEGYGLPETIRVTVGTHAENERFLAALGEVLGP